MTNLNEALILDDACTPHYPLQDYSCTANPDSFDHVEVVFRNLEERLIQIIEKNADVCQRGIVFGSVAWLTSFPILEALRSMECQILVQKEDFLRPDIYKSRNALDWKQRLHKAYAALHNSRERYMMWDPIGSLSVCGDPEFPAIMCVGNHNADKRPAHPRAHHKFLVFCREQPVSYNYYKRHGTSVYSWHEMSVQSDFMEAQGRTYQEQRWTYVPYAVWTGSFNFTQNGGQSLENALYLESSDPENPILLAYLKEHHQLFALAEDLDWDSPWVAPKYRIGT